MVTKDEDIIELSSTSKLQEKSTELSAMVRNFELRVKGYIWKADGNQFAYAGEVLEGQSVIQKLTGLLHPFCQESNLITIKDFKTFSRQKYRVNSTANSLLLAEATSLARYYSVVLEMFMDTLQNIGDIILGSQKLLQNSFGNGLDDPKEGGSLL